MQYLDIAAGIQAPNMKPILGCRNYIVSALVFLEMCATELQICCLGSVGVENKIVSWSLTTK